MGISEASLLVEDVLGSLDHRSIITLEPVTTAISHNMNAPESDRAFSPKQALKPTPELYGEIVGDGMERLAAASLSCTEPFDHSEVIFHDVGCGLGAGTGAIMSLRQDDVAIKGTDINEDVLEIYQQNITAHKWPAEALKMDASRLDFPDETFTHCIGNALLFVLENDGVDAIKEMHRTLKPGGVAILNSWAYTPTIPAIHAAAKKTRPDGTPLPREGLDKWEDKDQLRDVIIKGGFEPGKVKFTKKDVHVAVGDLRRFATMIWSFIGGTSKAGWLESDEENWDAAVDVVMEALSQTEGYEKVEDGKNKIMFKAHVAVATK
ncbi:s-adenosyl-l-methionine-dependent methyltransferase [Fusarium mexicanum]|uniref:S-adenosyl-l-methionine-dependent methyltransferase n=1 Tax=Fusarium mexicanum TaxID=751941 RepID=A0A8H5MYR9_9HYPO|nr:s-adenosyl-l-methionine-dependent methyltransferase [Fusarium mexicanum]